MVTGVLIKKCLFIIWGSLRRMFLAHLEPQQESRSSLENLALSCIWDTFQLHRHNKRHSPSPDRNDCTRPHLLPLGLFSAGGRTRMSAIPTHFSVFYTTETGSFYLSTLPTKHNDVDNFFEFRGFFCSRLYIINVFRISMVGNY